MTSAQRRALTSEGIRMKIKWNTHTHTHTHKYTHTNTHTHIHTHKHTHTNTHTQIHTHVPLPYRRRIGGKPRGSDGGPTAYPPLSSDTQRPEGSTCDECVFERVCVCVCNLVRVDVELCQVGKTLTPVTLERRHTVSVCVCACVCVCVPFDFHSDPL